MEKIKIKKISEKEKTFLNKLIKLRSALDKVGRWKRSFYDNWAN